MNYQLDVIRAQQRMNELVNEAHNDRLIPTQPGITDQILATVGTWMINTGERLTRLSSLGAHEEKLNVIETASS
ncbi:MAG: hypothetical protein GC179_12420 [Anaerolineaceae bacterium]|nr:hypothetical protein [Anaerolineaceae bacterium]